VLASQIRLSSPSQRDSSLEAALFAEADVALSSAAQGSIQPNENDLARMWFTPLIAALFPSADDDQSMASSLSIDVPKLVERAQQGHSEAAGGLYQLFAQPIYRYIAYRVPTTADAEDLTTEVFIRMVEGLPNYRRTEVPFEAWLYRIASARVADFYRRTGRQRQTELSDVLADYAPLPEEQVQQEQMFETVREALQQLSPEHQTILIFRFVERKSHEEVAAILKKSVTAVKSAQHRALSQLAALLGSDQKIRHYLRGDRD
jgi:RNA polymerase sigma-70 factor, ECF subfamily